MQIVTITQIICTCRVSPHLWFHKNLQSQHNIFAFPLYGHVTECILYIPEITGGFAPKGFLKELTVVKLQWRYDTYFAECSQCCQRCSGSGSVGLGAHMYCLGFWTNREREWRKHWSKVIFSWRHLQSNSNDFWLCGERWEEKLDSWSEKHRRISHRHTDRTRLYALTDTSTLSLYRSQSNLQL